MDRKTNSVRCIVAIYMVITALSSCSTDRRRPAANPDANVAARMLELTDQHRYDDAIQAGLHARRGDPSDSLLYEQIGLVYIKRASADPAQSEKWLALAADYSNRSVAADPNDQLNRLNVGRIYEMAGDVTKSQSCVYYNKSVELLTEVFEKVHNDAPQGPDVKVSRDPLKRESQTILSRVKTKSAQAGCK